VGREGDEAIARQDKAAQEHLELPIACCLLPTAMEPRPLKLALVTRRYPPLIGGAEKVLNYLARALAAEGAKVTVVTSRIPGQGLAAREEVPVEAVTGAKVKGPIVSGRLSVVRLETSRLRFWGTWRYMCNLRRWFEQNPVDLAYVSMLKHDAYVLVGAAKRLDFRVVLRPEGAGPTGDVVWQSWGNFGRTIGLRCRRADAFVAISKSIENELREAWRTGTMRSSRSADVDHHALEAPRIVAIPNGVPVPEKAWQRRTEWRASPRAMFVGRLAPEKGLDTVINAWPLVRAVYPDARLILIGEGPQRGALEDRAKALHLTLGPGQAVELPGASADPTKALRDADLFVLASREEGMSIALLEAMALGIPLVASSIHGNRQLVNDFEHGRLAPPGDPEGLARVIIDQWGDFDRAFQMSRAARNRVAQEFSIQRIARKHLELFQEIVGQQQAAGNSQ
jgi:glycosyltransferase involved in cell wall biosynthesis